MNSGDGKMTFSGPPINQSACVIYLSHIIIAFSMILVLKITERTNSGTIVTAQTALSYTYFFSVENEKRMHMYAICMLI